jgi:gamma-glutamylcyclotransferase (GGCT)/AIG2-like uncharacterized protein YtfP
MVLIIPSHLNSVCCLFNPAAMFNVFIGMLSGGKFLTAGRTVESYYMTGLASRAYPYLSRSPLLPEHAHTGPTRIHGEVYAVPWSGVTDTLDELEGHPTEYQRQSVNVEVTEGDVRECSIYFLVNPEIVAEIAASPSRFENVPSGDWKVHGGR